MEEASTRVNFGTLKGPIVPVSSETIYIDRFIKSILLAKKRVPNNYLPEPILWVYEAKSSTRKDNAAIR